MGDWGGDGGDRGGEQGVKPADEPPWWRHLIQLWWTDASCFPPGLFWSRCPFCSILWKLNPCQRIPIYRMRAIWEWALYFSCLLGGVNGKQSNSMCCLAVSWQHSVVMVNCPWEQCECIVGSVCTVLFLSHIRVLEEVQHPITDKVHYFGPGPSPK